MKRKWIAVLAIGIAMVLAGTASAHDKKGKGHGKRHAVGQCVKDAAAVKKECKAVCQENFLTAVDTCREQAHECVNEARDEHEACVGSVLIELRQCVEDTCAVFDELIEECRESFPAGSEERDKCIDGAQVQRFQCRDQCRESVDVASKLKVCRTEFKAALTLCKNPPEPTPQ